MATDNKTDWFPGSVKPIRSGVYERIYVSGKTHFVRYCYYTTEKNEWGMGAPGPHEAYLIRNAIAPNQSQLWRGLKENEK